MHSTRAFLFYIYLPIAYEFENFYDQITDFPQNANEIVGFRKNVPK